MNNAKHGCKVFSLCFLAALCLMVFAAPSAQAEGNYRIGLKNITESHEILSEDDVMFEFLMAKMNLEMLCDFTLTNGSIDLEGKSLGNFEFSKCELFLLFPLESLSKCNPTKTIILQAKGTLFLHNGTTYNLFTPDNETGFFGDATFSCGALPNTVKIGGSIVFEESAWGFETELVKHLIKQAPSALFPSHKLKFGLFDEMKIHGGTFLKLGGAVAGMNWSAVG